MGAVHAGARAAWNRVKPDACDPYKVQEAKVLAKFDRVPTHTQSIRGLARIDPASVHRPRFCACWSSLRPKDSCSMPCSARSTWTSAGTWTFGYVDTIAANSRGRCGTRNLLPPRTARVQEFADFYELTLSLFIKRWVAPPHCA